MVGNWKVYKAGVPSGHCKVTKEGLYYRFSCKCNLNEKDICRLIVQIGDYQKNLGVLVPSYGIFSVESRVSVRDFPAGNPEFRIESSKAELFVPLRPEEPFSYIAKLQDAYLARQNGQIGITIKRK